MARVTVEDCVRIVPNRFDLVMLAARRARDISAGLTLTVERDNDKNPVVALREIAEGTIKPDELREEVVQSLQKLIEEDEPEEEGLDLLSAEGALGELGTEMTVEVVEAPPAATPTEEAAAEETGAEDAAVGKPGEPEIPEVPDES